MHLIWNSTVYFVANEPLMLRMYDSIEADWWIMNINEMMLDVNKNVSKDDYANDNEFKTIISGT